MNAHRQQPTLVLGGTGKTGRRVAERLEARGVPVRALGREPRDFADFAREAAAAGVWDGRP
jgi:uncharacterized protein YbjT (DUF2867 family)